MKGNLILDSESDFQFDERLKAYRRERSLSFAREHSLSRIAMTTCLYLHFPQDLAPCTRLRRPSRSPERSDAMLHPHPATVTFPPHSKSFPQDLRRPCPRCPVRFHESAQICLDFGEWDPRLLDDAIPILPANAAARSDKMSPGKLVARMVSNEFGFCTILTVMASTSILSQETSGYSGIRASKT